MKHIRQSPNDLQLEWATNFSIGLQLGLLNRVSDICGAISAAIGTETIMSWTLFPVISYLRANLSTVIVVKDRQITTIFGYSKGTFKRLRDLAKKESTFIHIRSIMPSYAGLL